jgi:cyclohexadieny/prephenate dehydrogenase
MRSLGLNVTIVGVGLIGSSIGLAAKKRNLGYVIGVDRDKSALEQARHRGAIDEGTVDLTRGVRAADVVIFCTPVDRVAALVKQAAEYARESAFFTDVGSAKGEIAAAVDAVSQVSGRFIGAHPLAGSEKQGGEHADADLFVDRCTVLTPTSATKRDTFQAIESFWRHLGAKVRKMSPEDHDRAMACTSHVPHLVAAALAGILPKGRRELAATGFRDATRIAGGDPELWTPILQHNRAAVLAVLGEFEERLSDFRAALTNQDSVRIDRLLTQGKKVRDALGS